MLAIFGAVLMGCKGPPASNTRPDGFKVDYFEKEFFTYINGNGWSLKQGGLINEHTLRYDIVHNDNHVTILMNCNQQARLATTFEFRYTKGDPAAEALLQEILSRVNGINKFAKITDNQIAEQAAPSAGDKPSN